MTQKRRIVDKWWVKYGMGILIAVTIASITWLANSISTIVHESWAVAAHESMMRRITEDIEHHEDMDTLRFDFIKDNMGKSAAEIERNRKIVNREIEGLKK